jgi:hypothetical protein
MYDRVYPEIKGSSAQRQRLYLSNKSECGASQDTKKHLRNATSRTSFRTRAPRDSRLLNEAIRDARPIIIAHHAKMPTIPRTQLQLEFIFMVI